MLNRYIIIILIINIYCLSPVQGQINTYSPYSRFGLGELFHPGNIRSLSMGSTGIALRSNKQINYLNPASFSATDSLSFLFDFGMYGFRTAYKSAESSTSLSNFNLHHLTIAFPVTRWWKSSAGIFPYSTVGYNIQEPAELSEIGQVDFYFNGNGGLNKLYFGNVIQLANRLSVGLNIHYLFGSISHVKKLNLNSQNAGAIPRTEDKLVVGDMVYQFGLQYNHTFNNKYFVTLGAVIENNSQLKTKSYSLSELFFQGQPTIIGDSILLSNSYIINNQTTDGFIGYPGNMGIGISFGINNILTITGDYYTQDWSETLIMGNNDSLINSSSAHFGVEYIPSAASLGNYLGKVNYRFGGYFSNSYISIRGEQIKDYGMTFGVGLPLRNTLTTFNIGYILGQRGTLNNDLLKENYKIMHIGVTLHDIWFRKRKYD